MITFISIYNVMYYNNGINLKKMIDFKPLSN